MPFINIYNTYLLNSLFFFGRKHNSLLAKMIFNSGYHNPFVMYKKNDI